MQYPDDRDALSPAWATLAAQSSKACPAGGLWALQLGEGPQDPLSSRLLMSV